MASSKHRLYKQDQVHRTLFTLFFLALLLLLSFWVYRGFIWAPNYAKTLDFKVGKHRFDIQVEKSCLYAVGLSFTSKSWGGHQSMERRFGRTPWFFYPFATFDIRILDEQGQVVFSKTNLDRFDPKHTFYGPDPLKLVAGTLKLKPGLFTAYLRIRRIQMDFSQVTSRFFIEANPTQLCLDVLVHKKPGLTR